MTATIRGVEYFYVMVKDRPGEAYGLLSQLAAAEVNLLAFNAIPTGPEHTQLVLFPEKVELLIKAAEKAGLRLLGPERAFLIQGDDRLGAIADIHRRLLDAHINVYASSGVTDGRGGYGYILYVKADQFRSAALVLGA
jgi:predicted amino acid-binding ACT domain protein